MRGSADQLSETGFDRDGSTRLSYGAIGSYAFWLYTFGPALALLQHQLHFSYTVLGVYSALWSGGAALAGVIFAGLARRVSRSALLWWSAAVASGGAALFTAPGGIPLTMVGAAVLGLAGTTMLTLSQAILSDRHGPGRDRALTEANVGAAACAVVAPLLLGALQSGAAGAWRLAFALPPLVLAGLYVRYRSRPLPSPAVATASGRARLSLACWLLAILVAVGIAVEFCVIYFGTQVLTATGLSTARAATAMSSLYGGILVGRLGGALLTRRPGRTVPLLWISLAITAAGFLLFWLTAQPAAAITGLFFCGAGIANLYPLSLALTLAAAEPHGDVANARIQLLGGVLVIAAPYLLGSLADHVGLHAAFTIEPVLIAGSALLLLAGHRLMVQRPSHLA